MNLNQKVNSILGLLLIIVAFLTLGTYLFVAYQSPSELLGDSVTVDLSQTKKVVEKENLDEEAPTLVGENKTGIPDYCLDGSSIFVPTDKIDDENEIIFRINMSRSLDAELSCPTMVASGDVLRWNNKLIYTYIERDDSSCRFECEEKRKIFSYDLETGEEDVLLEQESGYGEEGVIAGPIFRFYIVDDYLYYSFYQSCIGCSFLTNTGANYRLNLNNPEDVEELNYEGALVEYENNYYHYIAQSDIGGSGISQLYEYDLDKDKIIKDYEIEEKLKGIILELDASKEKEEVFYYSIDLLGFVDEQLIIGISSVNWSDDKDTDRFKFALGLETGEVEQFADDVELDLNLVNLHGSLFPSVSNNYNMIKTYLEGFESKYHFISY